MDRFDFSKAAFYAVSVAGVIGIVFAYGLHSGANRTIVYRVAAALVHAVELTFEESSTLTKSHPKHFLQPSRYEGTGVTVNDPSADPNDLILMSGFFDGDNELRLIRRDGAIVARWSARFSRIFPHPNHLNPPPASDWNVDTDGALVLPDGSVVFNFEYAGLVKLDRCGRVAWTLARPTHHSVERAEGGGFWVPGRRFHPKGSRTPFPPFEPWFKEDTLIKVSDDGKVVTEISVPKLFYDNGLEALLTATGHPFEVGMDWDDEIVHLNKIDELPSALADDFPMFEAGDLAVSIREMNLVMVVDPDTRKIKWWRIGPWLRQHDPEFEPGGTLVVFNNNTYKTAFDRETDVSGLTVPRTSNIMEVDPVTGRHRVLYGDRKGQQMLSVIRGKHERTAMGGRLVTEFEGGRVFETDAQGRVIWEYINRYSPDEVAEITEARVYRSSYFNVTDWSCERPIN